LAREDIVQLFGRPARAGRLVRRTSVSRLEAFVERRRDGFLVQGTVFGRPGRIEVFRAPVPAAYLLNNWQSWGPMERVTPATRFPELEAIVRDYSPYLFSPVPDELLHGPVSDYFAAWDGGLAGFLTSRIGHPFFTVEGGDLVGRIDFFDAVFASPVPLESLVVLGGGGAGDLLETYAALVKRAHRVAISPWNPVGWCSWYHYFGKLGWPDVLENLDRAAAEPKDFPFDVIQVDDGYETEIGDWLSPKSGYPDLGGMGRAIREKGFRAGIWAAPFSAAETSRLFAEHPDWMVSETGRPKPCYNGWGRKIYALDTTHPDAKRWLEGTIKALTEAGFSYLKIDFLFAAAMPGGRRKAVTPVQAYREGLRVVRRAAGRAFVLGCGAPLLPSVGLVDGMRVGEDTAPYWKTKPSGFQGPNAFFALKNALMRQFMHRTFWLNDPDCLLVRAHETELNRNERELYALAAGALDNMVIDSDRLALLGPAEKDLLKRALALRGRRSRVLGLMGEFGEDAYIVEGRGRGGDGFDLAVNLSDLERTVRGVRIPPRSACLV
jgi:alpha-galactosidase